MGGPGAQLGPSPGGRRLEWTRLERRQGGDLEGGKENQRTGRAAKGPPAGAAKGPLQRERTKNKTWMPMYLYLNKKGVCGMGVAYTKKNKYMYIPPLWQAVGQTRTLI